MSSIFEKLKRPFRSKYLQRKNNAKISVLAKVFRGTEIEENVRIGPYCDITPQTSIGRWSNLTERITIRGDVDVGQFCAIAPEVWIQGHNHDMSKPATQKRWQNQILGNNYGNKNSEGVKIGDNVWIGARAIILPDVNISSHAIIGAGAVVTKDVEKFEVVGGNPANHIRYRFTEEEREEISRKKWTEMSEKELKRNSNFFNKNL
jgi:virginiamycin A acetyltransferase